MPKRKDLPDEDVAAAGVVLDGLLDAVGVVTLARNVDAEAQIAGKRLHGVVGALLRAV